MSKAIETMRLFEKFDTDNNKVEYNFGLKNNGEVITAIFNFTGDIQIESHQAGCGCSNAAAENNKVTVDLDLSKALSQVQKDNPGVYPITKTISIWMDDGQPEYTVNDKKARIYNPEKMRTVLYITGNVKV